MKYKLSFSAGSLLLSESVRIAQVYSDVGDWDEVKQVVLADNLMQKIRSTSTTRMLREIRYRLSSLTQRQLQLLISSEGRDQTSVLYLAICKSYELVRDFVVEVVRPKVLTFDNLLSQNDYARFIDNKSIEHPELLELSDSSANKLRQVIWRILAEAQLLDSTKSGVIIPFIPTPVVLEAVIEDSPEWLKVFLMSDTDIALEASAHDR